MLHDRQRAMRPEAAMIKNPYQKDYQNELKQNRHGSSGDKNVLSGRFFMCFRLMSSRSGGQAFLNVIWTIALWVIELGMGLLNPDSSRTAWIVFPYLFVILPLGYMLYGAVQLYRSTAPDAPGTL